MGVGYDFPICLDVFCCILQSLPVFADSLSPSEACCNAAPFSLTAMATVLLSSLNVAANSRANPCRSRLKRLKSHPLLRIRPMAFSLPFARRRRLNKLRLCPASRPECCQLLLEFAVVIRLWLLAGRLKPWPQPPRTSCRCNCGTAMAIFATSRHWPWCVH